MFWISFSLSAFAQDDKVDASENTHIVINDEEIQFADPLYIVDRRIFVPLRQVVEHLVGEVNWDTEKRQVLIHTSLGDHLIFTIDNLIMRFNDREYVMDTAPFIHEQRTYIPIRHAAEFLHAEVKWVEESRTAFLNLIPSLMENKLPYPVEVVEFDPESHPYFDLLTRIIQVEAGYESYEGQIAVGSVIMNRVQSERFPNSIYEVVYAPRQFSPAHNGLLDRSVPNESVLEAAKAVLNGENNVEGAFFFHNPKVSGGQFWNSLELVDEIGSHRFLK